jgi:hypothetical protein
MSYTLITQASQDPALLDRIAAAVFQEALDNPTFGDTPFGEKVIADNPNPGGDPAVITDAAILSSVQAHWPMEPAP